MPIQKTKSIFRKILLSFGILAALFLIGLIIFTSYIADRKPQEVETADAIIVLTGGPARIEEGIKLLASGKGQRLLISGVYLATKRRDLKRRFPSHGRLFDCCIDLGHYAQDTIGNAAEARAWVENRKISSVIVVTASFHMPRSLIEMKNALPGVKLIPYPVPSKKLHIEAWWAYPGTFKLLLIEYLKVLSALFRLCVSQIALYIAPDTV